MDPTDQALLLRFANHRDEAAFQELVKRHLALVHGVARRVTASDDLAKDAVQDTFVRLARRATLIPANLTLSAWLHRTCRSLAIDLVRAENTRRKHEMKAVTSPLLEPSSDELAWSRMAPVIDELVARLSSGDRDAILLRFYQNLSYPEIGRRLGLSEEAARQRAIRALDKLRALLGRRGIATSSAALSMLLPAQAAGSSPAALAAAVIQTTRGIAPILSNGLLSKFLTVTATHKTSLALAALILFATTAYTQPWSTSDPAGAMSKSTASSLRDPTQASNRTAGGRSLPSNSQGRLERLRTILAIDDAVERRRQMIALVDQISTTQFEDTCNSFLSLNRKDRAAEETLLTLAWTRADPQAALTYGNKHGLVSSMAYYWATFDPDAALVWVRANPEQGSLDYGEANIRLSDVLAGIARDNPAKALKILVDSTRTPTRTEISLQMAPAGERLAELNRLYFSMPPDDDALAQLLSGTTDESLRGEIINAAASAISVTDSEGAARLLLDHPTAADANLASQNNSIKVFQQWAYIDSAAVVEALVEGAPEIRAAVLPAVTLGLTDKDLPGAYAMLARCPEDDYLPWIDEMNERVVGAKRDQLATTMDQFAAISNEVLRDRAVAQGLREWLKQDAPAAKAWIDVHPISDAVQAKISSP